MVILGKNIIFSSTIWDICQMNNNTDRPNIILENYQYDIELMRNQNKVPFIIQDGRFKWCVHMDNVTMQDYYNTFGTKDIAFSTDDFQSGDYNGYVKRAKKEFWVLWKQFQAADRNIKTTILERIRFRRFLFSLPISPMSFIQALSSKQFYSLQDYLGMFDIEKKLLLIILKCLGYSIIAGENIKPNSDYIGIMHRITDKANDLTSYTVDVKNDKVYWFFIRLFGSIGSFFTDIQDKLRAKVSVNAELNEPVRSERERHNYVLILIVSLLVIFTAFLIFSVDKFIGGLKGLNQELWSSSISTFLGALAGAFLSGLATIFTTYLIINRSYKVDYHNERLGVLPVFSVKCQEVNADKKDGVLVPKKYYNDEVFIKDGIWEEQLNILFSNIGKGIAYDVKIMAFNDDYDTVEVNTVKVDESKEIIFSQGSHPGIKILYNDIYNNKYVQNIELYKRDSCYSIIEHRPELIMRTNRARYQQ